MVKIKSFLNYGLFIVLFTITFLSGDVEGDVSKLFLYLGGCFIASQIITEIIVGLLQFPAKVVEYTFMYGASRVGAFLLAGLVYLFSLKFLRRRRLSKNRFQLPSNRWNRLKNFGWKIWSRLPTYNGLFNQSKHYSYSIRDVLHYRWSGFKEYWERVWYRFRYRLEYRSFFK